MNIAVFGTGMVGQTLSAKLAALGYEVMIGTRDTVKTLARSDKDAYGNPPFSEWQQQHQGVKLGTFAEAAAPGELIINATSLAGGEHTVFVSGNDSAAKLQVTDLLKNGFGWQDVIDLGDISTARGTEMLLPLWTRLWSTLQTPIFSFKVVR